MASTSQSASQVQPKASGQSSRSAFGRSLRLGGSVVCVLILASVGAFFVSGAMSKRVVGPMLTHTVGRGDLVVTVVEQGLVESSENTEIKCRVRGRNTVLWVIKSGSMVKKGDELLRLDRAFIQEQIDERTKYAHWSRSAAERSDADVRRATLAVGEYEQGRYVSELMRMQKDLVVAESDWRSAKNLLAHAKRLASSEYISDLEVEERQFAVEQAELKVKVNRSKINVLEKFTQAEQLQTLRGSLASKKARHKANAERAIADASRRDRAVDEIQYCVVVAPRDGLVIHPNAAKWESAPIAEGSNVHREQLLLIMPNLDKMRVKVGVHESMIDRMKEGLICRVTLPDRRTQGKVSEMATVTRPAGWWTGNEVRYDTMVALPSQPGLRPGMSAEVEIIVAEYENVLTTPVAAIVETARGQECWVSTPRGPERRLLTLGDTNDVFTIVETGLKAGEEVFLNPLSIPEARDAAQLKPGEESGEPANQPKSGGKQQDGKGRDAAKKQPAKKQPAKKQDPAKQAAGKASDAKRKKPARSQKKPLTKKSK